MKMFAINGSPRKKWNTATMLEKVIDGAKKADPRLDARIVNLYDYHYQGCISCFACKMAGGKSYGKCAVKDDIQELLQEITHADMVVFGSPIYFGNVTGMMRSFMERLLFPLFVYDKNYSSLAPKKIFTAFIYTMNVPKAMMEDVHYPDFLAALENSAGHLFGHKPRIQYVNNTLQANDYAKFNITLFSEEEKKRYREEHFPKDCEKAAQLGGELARDAEKAAS